jgi:predicted dehydrogenase
LTGVALLGCGAIAAKRVAAMPSPLMVRAVYDIDTARADAFARSITSEPRVAASPEEALAGDVQLAIIATYHRDLAPMAQLALEAGCHVLIEKPGGRSSAELRPVRERATSRQRIVRVGYNHRFHPAVLRAHELVRSGKYGDVMNVRGRYGHGGRPGYEREWRADPELAGGGELLDQGVHLIDLVRHLTGDVTLAFAELRKDFWDSPVEDNAFLGLRPEAGGFAWLHASWTEWKNLFSLEIALERAKIEIVGLGGSYGPERLTLYEMLPEMGPPLTTTWEWPFPDISWEREMLDVAGAIAGAEAHGAGLDDAIAILDIVEQAYASHRGSTPAVGPVLNVERQMLNSPPRA